MEYVSEHQAKEEWEGHQRKDGRIQLLIGRYTVCVSDLLEYPAYRVFPGLQERRRRDFFWFELSKLDIEASNFAPMPPKLMKGLLHLLRDLRI